jgi:ribonucleoside-diphosphate reductase alpha chain
MKRKHNKGTGTTRAANERSRIGMSTVRLEAVKMNSLDTGTDSDIPMQPASQDIWDKKYRLKTKSGDAVDADIDGTYQRVAKALADAEPTAELRQYWNERFVWALRRGERR